MNARDTQNPARYVIQRHARGQHVHWDFMLESGNVLRTWRVALPPEQLVHEAVQARQIADHPVRFLTYEGPVNQGKGTVAIADSGSYTVTESPGRLQLHLQGRVLSGLFCLRHVENENWRFEAADVPTS